MALQTADVTRQATTTVRATASGVLQRQCACGQHTRDGECEACRKKRQPTLQRAAISPATPATVPPIVNDVCNAPGQPLAPSTRAFMESRFGHEFSQVRVHTDRRANDSAHAVNALAYTVGRNIVFGAGQYTPETAAGDALLAHELTHVIQQSHQTLALQTLRLGSPTSTDEREAEAVSAQIMSGRSVSAPRAVPTSVLQRKMLNKVETDFQKGAKACVVHLHGEERTALAAAKEIRSRRCVNLVHLDTTKRYVEFEIDVSGEKHVCEADPNRVFSDKGRRNDALADKGCQLATTPGVRSDIAPKTASKGTTSAKAKPADVKDAAAAELEAFVNNDWGKKISQCRGGDGSAVENGALPTLALHNNESLSLASYGKAKDVTRVPKGVANPTFGDPGHKSDFFFVTQTADFDALRDPAAKANVFLQADPVLPKGQDGSLSVALQSQRFINVEKEGRKHEKFVKKGGKFTGPDSIYARNYAMAAQALDLFGVPDGPCVTSTAPQSSSGSATSSSQAAARKATSLDTDKPLLGKDILPVGVLRDFLVSRFPWLTLDSFRDKGCTFFFNQSGLDKRRDEWSQRLGRMPLRNITNWILGVDQANQPPEAAEAFKEVKAQQGCLIKAMEKSLKAAGVSQPKGGIIRSEVRSFSEQESIWQRKFKFTGDKFGHISSTARATCAADKLIDAAEREWDPSNPKHKTCWSKLSSEEKEKEILMTSSAPGVSRHHAGTDFDFGRTGKTGEKDLTAEAWTGSGDFADVYRWLVPNAATYGFIQPFDTKGGYGKGYTAERWHWSYYPVAQALLEFARRHRTEIRDELKRQWSDSMGRAPRPEFKFIWDNWEQYLFNVEEKGIF
ncbi:hypothetical protein TFLX_01800 [Thermoflexales bacterium]|nr:hypothetical protein TFLX_01800 [Thermoflexales bacterium]